MPGPAASDPPSVTLSFANNFWGKDDAGVGPLLERMHNAKVTSDELKSFYAARGAIEEEYSRKLLHLSRKPLGHSETGTLRLSLDVVRAEVESMGKAHQNIASQMKTELEEPLAAFAGAMKERRKIVQNGIEKLLKIKTQQTMAVNKARDRYEQDCLKIKGFLAQAHMVMGQEERKNKAKLEKTQIQLSTTSSEYEAAVKVLEETTGRWNRDWKAACDKFQDLEEERIDYMKSSLWTFANIASTVCVSDDAACEKIRLSLEDCDVEKDITGFIKESGTGQEIPDPPKFINFCRGDADNASESSEDGNYSVAQFQRTMNPAFRTSSPQPSMFESHHDPDNPLAKELGLKDTKPISLQEISQSHPTQPPPMESELPAVQAVQRSRGPPPEARGLDQQPPNSRRSHPTPHDPRTMDRQSQMPPPARPYQADLRTTNQPTQIPQPQRAAQPDPRLIQAQQVAHQQYKQPVALNDYPMDGMTQFCRIAPPTERSSVPSPARPVSRDSTSHSDYSNPTSFSSIEPPSGSASPGKPMSQTPEPVVENKQVQKKKSGFFQNSPFRRKTKEDKVTSPEPIAGPSNRNTWGPVSKRTNNENISPTRPFGQGARGTILGGEARSASPEPIDPRASFQLNIGNNVFDVASPDARKDQKSSKKDQEELDPIAQALEELKGVVKQTSIRMSADRYAGLATPIPGTPGTAATPVGGVPTPLVDKTVTAAQRGTPPPSYEQPVSRLGAPKPAFTSRQMKQTTQSYVNQKTSMFSGGPTRQAESSSRPAARAPAPAQEPARAPSPAPPRAKSPRPGLYNSQPAPQPAPVNRGVSPSPYAASNAGGRPRAQTQSQSASPVKQPYVSTPTRESLSSSRGNSPGYAHTQRAVSPAPTAAPMRAGSRAATTRAVSPAPPQPQFRQSYDRPSSRDRPMSRAVSPAPPPQRQQPPPQQQPQQQQQFRQSQSSTYDRPASRAVSPLPQFRQSTSYDRPSSSRGSDMALQLAPAPSERGDTGSVYGGSQRGGTRAGASSAAGGGRPMSSYNNAYAQSESGFSTTSASNRARSKSLAEPRMYNKDGRMILHYSRAMYMYTAQIPEELSFAKGDILAVLRMQDDGWWEAEVVGRNNGRPGLVPSNYLQNC